MKRTAQILTLVAASILGLGAISMASRMIATGKIDRISAPQQITISYGDVPVSLTADIFQSPVDLSALVH
jgi:hypothetical protein